MRGETPNSAKNLVKDDFNILYSRDESDHRPEP